MSLCAMNGLLFSPFSLAERSASSRDEAAIVLVLLSVVLQEGVLVPVQVVHQVTIATVLCHQEQWPLLVEENLRFTKDTTSLFNIL